MVHRWTRAVLAALLTLALGFAGASVASAHTALVSSTPENGAALSAAPEEIVFTFSEPLLPDFVRFLRISDTGEAEDLGVTEVDGATARLFWPPGLPGGEWTVEYRVVSQDGHPVIGSIAFRYPSASPTPPPSPSPTNTSPTPSPTQTSTPVPTSTPTDDIPTPDPTLEPASDEQATTVGWLIAGIAVIVLAFVVIIGLVVRNRR
jgi:methionine-rich copper-binding protein CopC